MAYRKNMKFADFCKRYSGPDRMDFNDWVKKAEGAFRTMGKLELAMFRVFLREKGADAARSFSSASPIRAKVPQSAT